MKGALGYRRPRRDSLIDSVKLLLHFDMDPIIDQSPNFLTFFKGANASISLSGARFGAAGLVTTTQSQSWVYSNTTWSLAIASTDSFTLETWVNLDDPASGNPMPLARLVGGFVLYCEYNRFRFGTATYPTYQPIVSSSTGTAVQSTWHHVAVSRAGSSLKMFVDGVEYESATDTRAYTANSTLYLGGDGQWSRPMGGKLDEFRLTVGSTTAAARYTAAFALPDSQFSDIG